MNRINFGSSKPIIGMVHLNPYKSRDNLLEDVLKDVEHLADGGVNALLYENWGSLSEGRVPIENVRTYIPILIREASKICDLPYGVNILPLGYEAALDIVGVSEAKFVQVDTFVDDLVGMHSGRRLKVHPTDIIEYREKLGLEDIALLTNIQSKHYRTLPVNKKLETSALQAIKNGSDGLIVTGKLTGMKTPKSKLLRVRKVCGDVPVFIGSGLSAENVGKLLPYADGAIVGTSLKKDGITDNEVDEARVRQLMSLVHRLY